MDMALGALPIVLTKLGDLLTSKYNLQKEVKGEIRFLKAELESMKISLEVLSKMPPDQLDRRDKIWARDLRELSYDIEDSIDSFMLCSMGDRRDSAASGGLHRSMDIVLGALPSVLTKLGDLLTGEYNLQKGVKGEWFLRSELESMKGALEELSKTPPNQLDRRDKMWARALRELSYDIEDSIDSFMLCSMGDLLDSAASGDLHRSMDIVLGALPSVLTNLGDLLTGEYNLQKGVKGEIRFLQSELESMKGALEELSKTPPDQLDIQDKIWAWGLRELSYDIEDSIDSFMLCSMGGESAKLLGINEFIGRSDSLLEHANKIATKTQDISSHIAEMLRWHRRYDVNFGVDNPFRATVDLDPHLSDRYTQKKNLVGIDERIDELQETAVPMQKYGKIVSIVGCAGLGKTTLANAVYEKIIALFDCYAFVSVSQNPDLNNLFKGLLYDLGCKKIDEEIFNQGQLGNVLREFLQDKRYCFVIDDIWDISVWDLIKCALPDNDAGYMVITTTRFSHVAEIAGGAYKLEPLSLNNSRKLLYRRIFGNENQDNTEDTDKCPNQELAEVSDKILKKCAGVPLAITVMAGLLASKARNKMEWYEVYNSITSLDNSLDVVDMRMILSLGYYDLPSHLKCCFLYLSLFPKDYKIEKNRLIWRWIGEGFVQCEKQEKCLFELGESYFNELINRSVIQPIYNQVDMIYGCRAHDMMLDLILDLSREENFVTILNGMDCKSPSYKIRRLSLQNAIEDQAMPPTTTSLQQVRSVIVFPSAVGLMPVLKSFQVLRVLDLEDYDLSQGYSLNDLGKLFQLRYLGLRGTRIAQLPEEIENIQCLQTLDVRHTNISRLPSTVVQLGHLMCLYTDKSTRMPNGIGRLKSLEEFSTLRIDDSTLGIIEELGQLTELRVLKITLFCKWNSKLVECLSKLQKIQILTTEVNISNIGRLDAWVAPRRLHRLDTQWGCWFSTLPTWMNPSLLPDLSFLYIAVRELNQADLEILGRLPALRYLKLIVDHENFGIIEKFVVGSCLFPCLVQCQLFGFIIPVVFQQGALLRLASIKMSFPVRNMREYLDINGSFELGLGNLPSIQDVIILFNYGDTNKVDLEEVKASLRHEIEVHPNRPTLRIVVTDKKDFKNHVKDMHDREYRYMIDDVVDEPVKATVFPCLFTQYMKVADLVGNEETLNELLKIITEGTEMSVAHGKIVSIVGLGGLGKTTLAHAIYRKLRAQFDCWAYVSVSRNPDMKKLFKCMLYQLGKKNNANIHEGILDERQLIYELNEFLQKRRYFIVIDDIRDILVWNMIKCALPTNDGGFIIIATTCILDVAKQVGGTYMMRPLCLQNSRILLHRKTFGIEDKDEYADEELTEISEKILQKCGGVPLAIITISGLLASKRKNKIEWYKFYDSIDSVVKNSLDVESMKNILSLNYSDLPSHLRTCLLYLSVFPEGHDIDKDRLIRLWIAEGLIQCGKQEENPFELGESYFYELINRSMIQPVYKRWYYDMTECCQVHDMVLDLILYLSGKEVQWLSLQNSMVDIATHEPAVNMQEVRSVIVFPSAVKLLPALACFKVLRVLDLQSCCLSQGCSLKYLGNLFHLRYLGLRGTGIASLSEEIGKLQFLQTLDVTGNEIFSLPFTVAELKHLMCLHIDSRTGAPNGIGSFTSLEELSTLRIQDSTDIIEKLGNQTELRVLGIDCRTGWNVNRVERSLVDCLHKLQKIKTLSISMVGECNLNAWVPPRHLRKLELTGCWRSPVSALLNNASLLVELYFLSIEVRKLRQEDLESLGRLPALSYLDIEVGNQKLGIVQTFIIGARSFPCLVHCTLRGYIGPVAFQQGAMPEVARLHMVLPVREVREAVGINGGGFGDLGFGNLLRLQDVSFLLRRGGASTREVKEAEAGLRQAIESHPNHPTLEIL